MCVVREVKRESFTAHCTTRLPAERGDSNGRKIRVANQSKEELF